MNVLWLAWKDFSHPERGGAEVVLRELMARQVAEGHTATLLTARYPGSTAQETLANGIQIIRVGSNRYVHSAQALLHYVRHMRDKFDVVIETVNTMPYLSLFFRGKAKGVAMYHQLARDIWFFETKPPISHAGYYVIEPALTWLLGRSKAQLVTVSESTKKDLMRFGWSAKHAHIIPQGITMTPLSDLRSVTKYKHPTMLSFGTVRAMKRTADQVRAFEIAKATIPDLQLKVAGGAFDAYGREVIEQIKRSPFARDIEYLGPATEAQKMEVMQRSHVITVTSIKEGWGLIVSEAASQGTPAVVYDVDGLRDSVRHNQTGLVTKLQPAALAAGVTRVLTDKDLYDRLQHEAWQWSTQMTFDRSYQNFKHILQEA